MKEKSFFTLKNRQKDSLRSDIQKYKQTLKPKQLNVKWSSSNNLTFADYYLS